MPGTATAGRTSFIPFAFSSSTTGAVIKPVIPLFQAFSLIPAQRSTYCDCIKVGRKIDTARVSGLDVMHTLNLLTMGVTENTEMAVWAGCGIVCFWENGMRYFTGCR